MSETQGKGDGEFEGEALVKETCRRIRLARKHWDAHENGACRSERERALALYGRLSKEQKEGVPQVLRVWLRYRSEKYFGPERTAPGGKSRDSRGTEPRKASRKEGARKAGSGKDDPGAAGRRGA